MPNLTVFNKQYCGESLCDVYRDVDEAFDERFTPVLAQIPTDEYGFSAGTFTVSITWKPE